jgi:hypothetical protein
MDVDYFQAAEWENTEWIKENFLNIVYPRNGFTISVEMTPVLG